MSKKTFSLDEVKQHKDAKSLWIIINNKVYDVTKFIEEHPGGEEVLLEQAGGFATDAFEDVGHSTDARELMGKYEHGELREEDKEKVCVQSRTTPDAPEGDQGSGWTSWLIPLGIAIAAALVYRLIISPTN